MRRIGLPFTHGWMHKGREFATFVKTKRPKTSPGVHHHKANLPQVAEPFRLNAPPPWLNSCHPDHA